MAKHPPHRKLFALSLALLSLGTIGTIYSHWPRAQSGLPTGQIDLEGHVYEVELATTEQQHEIGLMHRTHLDAGKGMLFIYPQPMDMAFWMKDTLIPLDILFFDEKGMLVAQHRNVPPCKADPCPTYASGKPARYVVELAAGQAQAIHLSNDAQLKKAAAP